jgi:phosphate transport system substrate-binding protein
MFFVPNLYAEDAVEIFKGESGSLSLAGGTAHIPVLKEAAKRIMKYNHDIRITIGGGGSGVGIKKVGEGLIDIGNSGRKPSPGEISKYGLELYRWAIDGVTVVVHPSNKVNNLDTDTLKKIFSGKIKNWSKIGGSNAKINIYTRDNSSGTRKVFWKKALNKGEISPKALFISSNGAMKTAVAKDKNSIGYISIGHLDNSVKGLSLNGISPELENVKSGEYKVARGLYSNTKGEAKGLERKFIDYLYTLEGQSIIASKGFIPVKK